MRKKHAELLIRSSEINFRDLDEDPVVKFQKKHYMSLYLILCVTIQVILPSIIWNLPLSLTFTQFVVRTVTILHSTWFVNSTAHMFGDRPYNKSIEPRENATVSFGTGLMGEGYHNYHHTYPHDYATSESGSRINMSKLFIDCCSYLNLAHNLRRADQKSVLDKKSENAAG